jgi:hypothetical protein
MITVERMVPPSRVPMYTVITAGMITVAQGACVCAGRAGATYHGDLA